MAPKIKLTVVFEDKGEYRQVSGAYDWQGAMLRLGYASNRSDFRAFYLGGV